MPWCSLRYSRRARRIRLSVYTYGIPSIITARPRWWEKSIPSDTYKYDTFASAPSILLKMCSTIWLMVMLLTAWTCNASLWVQVNLWTGCLVFGNKDKCGCCCMRWEMQQTLIPFCCVLLIHRCDCLNNRVGKPQEIFQIENNNFFTL